MKRTWRIPAALVVALLAGCASVHQANALRDAQDAFSRGAEVENEEARVGLAALLRKFEPGAADPAAATGRLTDTIVSERPDPKVYYGACRDTLAALTPEDRAALARDDLLGNALALEALAEYKLGDHAAALHLSAEALRNQPGPRDRALMIALPGILIVAEARTAIAGASSATDEERKTLAARHIPAIEGTSGALDHLEKALADAGDHPIAVLLLHHELAAYQVLLDAYVKLAGKTGLPEPRQREARERIEKLRSLTGSEDAARGWELRLGL